MILCDTNILIEIYKGNEGIINVVKSVGQHNLSLSDVTCAELLYGARNKRELQAIRKDLSQLTILPIEASISNMAVGLIEKFALSHKLSLPDALIASTTIFYNIELYTLNLKDFDFLDGLLLFSN